MLKTENIYFWFNLIIPFDILGSSKKIVIAVKSLDKLFIYIYILTTLNGIYIVKKFKMLFRLLMLMLLR